MSINTVITIDGFETDDIGLIIDSGTKGWRDSVDLSHEHIRVPNKFAWQLSTNEKQTRMRSIVCAGSQWGTDLADLTANLDELKYRLNKGEAQIIFADQPGRYYKAYLDGDIEVEGIHPEMTRFVHEIQIPFICPDPRLYETANQNPTLSGDTAMPLGTAPVGGVFTVPATTFTLTYKHYDTTTLHTLTVTGASASPVTVDMENESIVAGGVGQTDKITAGDFFLFDPNDGDQVASEFPTCASTVGSTTVLYQKTYL